MAAKYQLITELYQRTGAAVSRNPQAWQSFLSSACRNYKCRYKMSRPNVQKILYKNVQLVCLS